MAEWIQMPLGLVIGVGLCIGILDFDGECRRGRDSSEGEFGASHGNQGKFDG